jgi:hypothetical protein
MKKLITVVLAVVMLATTSGVALAGQGNGAPTGEHFNLNIIGMKYEKDSMGVKEGGHVIFVELYSTKQGKVRVATDINLSPGDSFYVVDGNGTDGEAEFQLPSNVATEYTVWARPLGKPDGEAHVQTCAWDPIEEEYVCNIGRVFLRERGNKPFIDVTSDLLYIDGVPLFDPVYEDYFWSYQNNGLKLLQLRFYPVIN